MSEKSHQDSTPLPAAQSQGQRWLTYGSNVAITCVIVVILAGMLVYLTQHYNHRFDTTQTGLYSLNPQTLNIIKNNHQHIRIVNLYTRQKPPEAVDVESNTAIAKIDPAVEAQTVADLLEEYKNKGVNIDVEDIDPIQNPGKVDSLIDSVVEKYNTEIKSYKDFIHSLPAKTDEIKSLGDKEVEKLKTLVPEIEKIKSEEVAQTLNLVGISVSALPRQLKENDQAVQRMLTQKLPDYRGITDSVQMTMSVLSSTLKKITEDFTKFKDDNSLPPTVCKYMADDLPQYQKLQELADALAKNAQDVGQAQLDKYDTLRDALLQSNPIIVEKDDAWRILSNDKVWRANPAEARQVRIEAGAQLHRQFRGEQLITTAILALQMKEKPKICFVRAGGPPMAASGIPGLINAGPFSGVADLLRDYNFDVLDKDLTGMYAIQSQGQAPPEPSDAEIADAIWVVFTPPDQSNPYGMGPPTIDPKVADHLGAGRAALIVTVPGGDKYATSLRDWGITFRTDLQCVHEPGKGSVRGDWIDEAQQDPTVFQFNDYGNIPLARPLHSLAGLLFDMSPVQVTAAKGITVQSFLPLPGAPDAPNSWAAKDFSFSKEANLKFDATKGDLPGPLFVGAAAENEHGQRVVAVGTFGFMYNPVVYANDPELLHRGIVAQRFPGDGQLFANIIYWLAHQESMIAIGPSAMDVSRVADMSKTTQWLLRYGLLLILLPGMVLLAGVLVYFARRD